MLTCLPSAPLLLRHSALNAALLSVPFLLSQKCPCYPAIVRPLSACAEMPLLPCCCPSPFCLRRNAPVALILLATRPHKIGSLPMAVPAPATHPKNWLSSHGCPCSCLPPIPIILALCLWLALLMLAIRPLLRLSALPCPRWGQSCSSMPPMGAKLEKCAAYTVMVLSCGCCFRAPVVVCLLLSYACCCTLMVLVSCWCRAAATVVRLLLSCACCCRMPVVCLLLSCAHGVGVLLNVLLSCGC